MGWHVLRFSEGRGERRSASGHALPVGQDVPPNPKTRLDAILGDVLSVHPVGRTGNRQFPVVSIEWYAE